MLDGMFRELLVSARNLGRRPGFTLLVVGVLGLGIGANTAIYSLIDRVLLRPFSYRDAERLVEVTGQTAQGRSSGISYAAFQQWKQGVRSFEQAAIWKWRDLLLTGVADPENLLALEVSEEALDLLGVRPALGRLLRADDYQPGSGQVVVLSDRVWRKHFNADRAIVGRQILLEGRGFTVVGVMPREFVFTNPLFQLWVPLDAARDTAGELARRYSAVARLRSGASIEQAQREFDAMAPSLPRPAGDTEGWRPLLRSYAERASGGYRSAMLMLLGAVVALLLIACANAASLLLARASERRRELAVRASLGARPRHLLATVIAEAIILGSVAAAAGVAAVWMLLPALAGFLPNVAPGIGRLTVTPVALAATGALALLTALVCAVPSCLDALRAGGGLPAGGSSRTVSAGRQSTRLRSLLIAVEVALSVALLISAGLMVRSLGRLLDARRLGLETEHVLTARVPAPPQLRKLDEVSRYFGRVLAEVQGTPGIRSAGLVTILPFNNLMVTTSFTAEGVSARPDAIHLRSVSPDYFRTLGIRLLRGRAFTRSDTAAAPKVAIVNQELARICWPGEDGIGRRVSRASPPGPNEWYTVVGVVENTARRDIKRPADPELYRPFEQDIAAARATTLVIRAHGDPLTLGPSISRRIHDINPDQPVSEIKTMETWLHEAARQPRLNTLLLEIFAGVALALAASGIFGVVSYVAAQRTREFGIRSALGATAADLASLVAKVGMRPVLAGAVVGVALAAGAARMLEVHLFETPGVDPAIYCAVVGLLVLTALAAMAVPAVRAARVDPAITLRTDS